MEIGIIQIVALVCAVASVICSIIVGALAFFIKKAFSDFACADKQNADDIKKNAEDIKKVEEKLGDLKSDLPLIYVTREDFIRIMNRVEDKLDQLVYGKGNKGKEE